MRFLYLLEKIRVPGLNELMLTIVMSLICNGYRDIAPDVMVWSALKGLLW